MIRMVLKSKWIVVILLLISMIKVNGQDEEENNSQVVNNNCAGICPNGSPPGNPEVIVFGETCLQQDKFLKTLPAQDENGDCDFFSSRAAFVCGCPNLEPITCPLCESTTTPLTTTTNLPDPQRIVDDANVTCFHVQSFYAFEELNSSTCRAAQSTYGTYCGCFNPIADSSVCRICGGTNLLPQPNLYVNQFSGSCIELEFEATAFPNSCQSNRDLHKDCCNLKQQTAQDSQQQQQTNGFCPGVCPDGSISPVPNRTLGPFSNTCQTYNDFLQENELANSLECSRGIKVTSLACECPNVEITCPLCPNDDPSRRLRDPDLVLYGQNYTCLLAQSEFGLEPSDSPECKAAQAVHGTYCGCPRSSVIPHDSNNNDDDDENNNNVCRICGNNTLLPKSGNNYGMCLKAEFRASLDSNNGRSCRDARLQYQSLCCDPTTTTADNNNGNEDSVNISNIQGNNETIRHLIDHFPGFSWLSQLSTKTKSFATLLDNPNETLTLFAPFDSAFANFAESQDFLGELYFEDMLYQDGWNQHRLCLLMAHVVQGQNISFDNDFQQQQQQTLGRRASTTGSFLLPLILESNPPQVNSIPIVNQIPTLNGIVYTLERELLLPSCIGNNIWNQIQQQQPTGNNDTSSFVLAIQQSLSAHSLVHLLEASRPLTVLVPTNNAFATLESHVRSHLFANPDKLDRVLKYHILTGDVYFFFNNNNATSSLGDRTFSTLEGTPVTIEYNNNSNHRQVSVLGNEGRAILNDGNRLAQNGILYTIDSVLLPPNLNLPPPPIIMDQDIIASGKGFPTSEPTARETTTIMTTETTPAPVGVEDSVLITPSTILLQPPPTPIPTRAPTIVTSASHDFMGSNNIIFLAITSIVMVICLV